MKRVFSVLVFLTLYGSLAFAQMEDYYTVAKVGISVYQPISVKEFKDYVKWLDISRTNAAAQLRQPAPPPLTTEERRDILDTICNQLLVCQAAEQERITITAAQLESVFNKEIEPLVADLSQKLGRAPSDAEINEAIRSKTGGMTRDGFKELVRRAQLTEKYLQFKKQTLLQADVAPTETEIQSLYTQARNEGGFFRPDTIRIRMVVVRPANQAAKAAALEKANQLVRQIGGDPGKFDEVVADSRNANSGYEGGDTYLYKIERIRAEIGIDFYDTAFSLKQGEVSKLLEGPDGYYIIKVIETLRQKTFALNDVYTYDNGEPVTVRKYIVLAESQKRYMANREKASIELVEELKKRGKIEIDEKVYNGIKW
jgi:parvulin-like peptidyl-prolyl isomerase